MPNFEAKIIYGPLIVYALPSFEACTFADYSDMVLLPWIKNQLKNCPRRDIVWVSYKKEILKETTTILKETTRCYEMERK